MPESMESFGSSSSEENQQPDFYRSPSRSSQCRSPLVNNSAKMTRVKPFDNVSLRHRSPEAEVRPQRKGSFKINLINANQHEEDCSATII